MSKNICTFCTRELANYEEDIFCIQFGRYYYGEILRDGKNIDDTFWHGDCLKQFDHQFYEIIYAAQMQEIEKCPK